jgi:hypothetical protein
MPLSLCQGVSASNVEFQGMLLGLMWNLRVHFACNVETPKSKTQFSFPQIPCKGTELLLKKLKILGPS